MTDAIRDWRTAAESGDAELARACLAGDAVLSSPLTNQFEFHGADHIAELLGYVFEIMTGIRFTDQLGDGKLVVLFASAQVSGRPLEETQRIRLGDDGLIQEITLFIRPLPAITGLLRQLGPLVAKRQQRPVIARVLGAAGTALDGMAASGDRHFMPLVAPPAKPAN